MNSKMMMDVVLALAETFFFFGLGALIFVRKLINGDDVAKLSRLTIDILLPFLTFASVTNGFSNPGANASALWQLPLLGFLLMLISALLGFVLQYGLENNTEQRMAAFRHLCVANNYLFLPLILIDNMFGLEGVAYLLVLNIGSTIAFWTLAITVLGHANWKSISNGIFSTNTAAAFLAVIFVVFSIPVPAFFDHIFAKIGAISIPLTLILIGASLYASSKTLFQNIPDLIFMIFVRLFFIPVILITILLFIPFTDPMTRNTAMIVATMPASCSSVLIVKKYGASEDFTGQTVFFTTILCLLSVPLLLSMIFT